MWSCHQRLAALGSGFTYPLLDDGALGVMAEPLEDGVVDSGQCSTGKARPPLIKLLLYL